MAVQQRVYDVDAFWQLVCQPENADKQLELINGEVFEMAPPGEEHGVIAGEIAFHIRLFDRERKLGILTVETGYYTLDDRRTLLAPDVAFRRTDRAATALNKKWVPTMPDIAVEVQSPSNTLQQLRRKAAIYLQHGTSLVWIVIPDEKGVEVCQLSATGDIERQFIGEDGALSGESVLPGFTLDIARLFL